MNLGSPRMLRLCGSFVLATAAFNFWLYSTNASAGKDGFTLAIVIFGVVVGLTTLFLSFKAARK